jgi:hypothetical protein
MAQHPRGYRSGVAEESRMIEYCRLNIEYLWMTLRASFFTYFIELFNSIRRRRTLNIQFSIFNSQLFQLHKSLALYS